MTGIVTYADLHPCADGCGRDSEYPGPCETCSRLPTVFIPASEWSATKTTTGAAARIAGVLGGHFQGFAGRGEVMRFGSTLPASAPRPVLAYTLALNGWRLLEITDVVPYLDRRGRKIVAEARVHIERIGAQIVEIDPVHGTGFAEGCYYGSVGAWGGYAVRRPEGPWYRFTLAKGLQPCPAAEAIADLERRAARTCAGACSGCWVGSRPLVGG